MTAEVRDQSIGGATSKGLVPFVLVLPDDNAKYHELLKPPRSVVMHSGVVTLRPDESVGSHTTGKHEELLVILDGIGEVELGGFGRKKVHGGCVAYVPPLTQHNVLNVGTQPLRYVFVVSRAE